MKYLCSFRPLAESPIGQLAVEQFKLPPFVDASCRREPDFASSYPSITALCRSSKFAPRLGIGDAVVYITRKANYFNAVQRHWRMVAILKVVASYPNHTSAAAWFTCRSLPLPSNCVVPGNPPLPLEMTDRHRPDLRRWEAIYRLRARTWGVFHICESLFCDLHHPPAITDAMMMEVFGRIPNTRNPPAISELQFASLKNITKHFKPSN